MRRKMILASLLLIVLPLILLVNSQMLMSSILGIIVSVLFLSVSGVAIGNMFFSKDGLLFRAVFGFATLLVVLSLVGTVLISLAAFQELISSVAVLVIGVVLAAAFLRFNKASNSEVHDEPGNAGEKMEKKFVPFLVIFLVFVVFSFVMLWGARTGEGVLSVWATIPNMFGVVFFAASLSLAIFVLLAHARVEYKLSLICLYSFLLHSLFLMVWYPGRYGDPWAHLGETRYIVRTGMPTAYDYMLQNLDRLFLDFIKYRTQHSVVAFSTRMFSVDIYWVNVLIVPALWSLLVPILAYKFAETMTDRKTKVFPLLSALITSIYPTLVIWGAVSTPNSLGFIFFFLTAALVLLWMKGGGRKLWVLAFLASVVTFLAHPQPGIFAFMWLLIGSIVKETSSNVLRIVGILLVSSLYPLALAYGSASLSLGNLLLTDSFLSFQSEMSTLLLIFGFAGILLGIRSKYLSSRVLALVLSFYVAVLLEYYFTAYGMVNLPFGPARVLVMSDFVMVPFVALGLLLSVGTLMRRLSWRRGNPVSSSKGISRGLSRKAVALLLIGLYVSFQATLAMYQAYPSRELLEVQPAAYEVDAIRFIDADTPYTYVVLCEPTFGQLAVGFLGSDYAYGENRGNFGPGDWGYPTVKLYLGMAQQPSVSYMQQGMEFAKKDVSYFVVSVRDPDFDGIVKRTLEVLQAYQIFGNGKLYVFKYPLPITEEPGPTVKVVYDDGVGTENVQTGFRYIVKAEVNSTLTVSGHASFNITEFPETWTFLELTVNNVSTPFDVSSDISNFVYVRGLDTSDVLRVTWLTNLNLLSAGWKDDSLKTGWQRQQGSITPSILNDGNILTISYTFTLGDTYEYYYHEKSLAVSTDQYDTVTMRWKSTGPVAYAVIYFVQGGAQNIVELGSESADWTTTIVKLQPGLVVSRVMVGITDARTPSLSGLKILYVDYVLIAKGT